MFCITTDDDFFDMVQQRKSLALLDNYKITCGYDEDVISDLLIYWCVYVYANHQFNN